MREPIVRLEQVSKRYVDDPDTTAALHDVTLTIEAGEFLGIMGQSGSGKTTLLNLVGGLDRSFRGTIEVLGRDLAKLGDGEISRLRNESIGFVFQAYHLLSTRTCGENIALPALFRSQPLPNLEARIDEVLGKVGLLDRKQDRPTSLSGGQKQRIAIARALLLKPRILLCDEPTGNLDQRTGGELIETLAGLATDDGVTVVIVTHEEHVAERCDRIIRLRNGQVVDETQEGLS